jgi:quercetin dioxygenase-like cupin family protein
MKRTQTLITSILVMAVVMIARFSFAADPLEVAPDMYKLKFENEKVRVMEVTFQPGQTIAEHSHPDHFVFVEEGGQLTITVDGAANPTDLKAGDVVWLPAQTHSAVNTGTTVVKLLVTEIK